MRYYWHTSMVRSTGWRLVDEPWPEFAARLMTHKTTGESAAEWKAMPKERKDTVKDVGCFVGGVLREGTRSKSHILTRSMLTLDADRAKPGLWDIWDFLFGNAAVMYQTHSWTEEKPKVRLVVPLSREVEPDLFRAISVWVSAELGADQFDHTCHQPERLMHFPSLPVDVKHQPQLMVGPLFDVDEWIAKHPMWNDISTWPVVDPKVVTAPAGKKHDPREIPGLVGLFNRTYTVPEAIEKFLGDVYESTDAEDRYTFKAGSSAKGLQIFDDGLLAISHHATDPAGDGHEYNAYDLVRVHLFGRDEDPSVPLGDRPSSRLMREMASDDDEVVRRQREETNAAAQAAFEEEETTGIVNPRALFFRRVAGHRDTVYTPSLAYQWYSRKFIVRKAEGVLHRYVDGVFVPAEEDFRRQLAVALSEEYLKSRVNEAIAFAEDICPTLEDVMGDESYLNLKNGLYSLEESRLVPHDPDKAGTVRIPWAYDPEAKCPTFDRFLSEYVPGYEETIWYMFGLPLISSQRMEKTILLLGSGKNGKGTLLDLLTKMLGEDNVSHISIHTMEENRFAASDLVGKLANIQTDLPTRPVNPEGVFKAASSGDRIRVERKNQQAFSARIRAKMMFSANDLAGTKDTSNGFFRRWCIIPLDRTFEDQTMRAAIFTEIPGILVKAIEYARRLLTMDEFPSVGLADEYRAQADSVYGFFKECCIKREGSRTSIGAMHSAYSHYCKLNNHVDIGRNRFGARLISRCGLQQGRTKTGRFWCDVVVTSDVFEGGDEVGD